MGFDICGMFDNLVVITTVDHLQQHPFPKMNQFGLPLLLWNVIHELVYCW